MARFSGSALRWGALNVIVGIGVFAGASFAQAQSRAYGGQYNASGYSLGGYHQTLGTSVYVNGRQLSYYEVAQLRQIFGYVQPGSYWLLRNGAYGHVGGPALGNLYTAIQARRAGASSSQGGRINHHSRGTLVVPGHGVLLPDGTSATW